MHLKGLRSVEIVPASLSGTAGGEQRRSANLSDRMEVEVVTAAQQGEVVMLMLAMDVKAGSILYSSTILHIHFISHLNGKKYLIALLT